MDELERTGTSQHAEPQARPGSAQGSFRLQMKRELAALPYDQQVARVSPVMPAGSMVQLMPETESGEGGEARAALGLSSTGAGAPSLVSAVAGAVQRRPIDETPMPPGPSSQAGEAVQLAAGGDDFLYFKISGKAYKFKKGDHDIYANAAIEQVAIAAKFRKIRAKEQDDLYKFYSKRYGEGKFVRWLAKLFKKGVPVMRPCEHFATALTEATNFHNTMLGLLNGGKSAIPKAQAAAQTWQKSGDTALLQAEMHLQQFEGALGHMTTSWPKLIAFSLTIGIIGAIAGAVAAPIAGAVGLTGAAQLLAAAGVAGAATGAASTALKSIIEGDTVKASDVLKAAAEQAAWNMISAGVINFIAPDILKALGGDVVKKLGKKAPEAVVNWLKASGQSLVRDALTKASNKYIKQKKETVPAGTFWKTVTANMIGRGVPATIAKALGA